MAVFFANYDSGEIHMIISRLTHKNLCTHLCKVLTVLCAFALYFGYL